MHVSLWFSVKEDDQRFPLEIGLLRVCPALHCCWMPYSRTLHQGLRRLLLTASSSAPLLKLLLPEVSTRRQHFLMPTPLITQARRALETVLCPGL